MAGKSIELERLKTILQDSEKNLAPDQKEVWDDIKIEPEKWSEESKGHDFDGFWVVALLGDEIIWYNDISKGFNISEFKTYGTIDQYWDENTSLPDLLWHIL